MKGLSKVLVLGILGMSLLPVLAEAADLYVPGGYATIQSAVNAANSGDTINVAAGTYNEAVYITKGIALVGAGSNSTTIAAQGLGDTNTVTFNGTATNNASISNFTIMGATGDYPNGRGITCSNGSPSITNNTISGNKEGIICDSSSPSITNNTISGNKYDGINCYSSFPPLVTTMFGGIVIITSAVMREQMTSLLILYLLEEATIIYNPPPLA